MARGIIDIDKLNHALDEIQMAIYNAEPIIRCKDCEHWAKRLGWCNITDLDVEPDFYCAYAERKEE